MINVQMVSVPGCVHCGQVRKVFEELRPQYPDLKVEDIDATTPEGTELVIKYGILSSPGVIINNELFSTGGLNKSEFIKKIESLREKGGD